MSDARIIRWLDLTEADASGWIEVVRSACWCLARDPDSGSRPTLFVLDHQDLAGGILEALLGLPHDHSTERARDLIRQFQSLVEEHARIGKSLVPVMALAQPSLEAWESNGENWPGWKEAKKREFLLRMMESYRLLLPITGVAGSSTDDAARKTAVQHTMWRLRCGLEAFAEEAGPDAWSQRLALLTDDIGEVHDLAKATLAEDAALLIGDLPEEFVRRMALMDQFGKRPAKDVAAAMTTPPAGKQLGSDFDDGSYGLRQQLREAMRKQDTPKAGGLFRKLEAYHVLRDCARWLGDGAFAWARKWPATLRDDTGATRAGRFLFVDENLGGPGEGEFLRRRLSEILQRLFPQEVGVEVDAITHASGILPDHDDQVSDSITALDTFFGKTLLGRVKRASTWRSEGNWGLENTDVPYGLHAYDAIFCEVDYGNRFAGPQVVQKLVSYLERTAGADGPVPPVLVLSHQNNFGHVQQCLNLGAQAFVDKDRLFQIPSRLKRAIADIRAQDATGARKPSRERFGEHSNFRTLYSLRPDQAANLRSHAPSRRIGTGRVLPRGGMEKTDASWPGYRRRASTPEWDPADRGWIHSLPKADLHCHFGTCISLPTIEALAFNTCGHLFRNGTDKGSRPEDLPGPVAELIRAVCRIVVKARKMRLDAAADCGDRARHPAEHYFRAMEIVLQVKERAARVPDNPYDRIAEELGRGKPPVQSHIIVALLVVATACLRRGEAAKADALGCWEHLRSLATWCRELHQEIGNAKPAGRSNEAGQRGWPADFVLRAARLAAEAGLAYGNLLDTHAARQPASVKPWDRVLGRDVTLTQCGDLWAKWYENVCSRIETTFDRLVHFLAEALVLETTGAARPSGGSGIVDAPTEEKLKAAAQGICEGLTEGTPTLQDLVALPLAPGPGEQSLLRYLWGTGLLGAEHLQYAENLILAAQDFVGQNARDYVVYSEVRCETPGYTRAGLSAEAVTNLLCAAFDLAAVYEVECEKRTFVRTNVLLAAKRHKPSPDRQKVIALLTSCLARRDASRRPVHPGTPAWWRPAEVVGFDVSGNEAEIPKDLRRDMQPLIEISSPITIHAGEAASADSIWDAVYEWHARRIGHGLRLREDPQLLKFCINEGICMEMCPISNRFTSDFVEVAQLDTYEGRWLEHYPLRHFMDSGLEVCVNTDNRFLHGDYGTTLTDEYLWAARLSGGFTRWEVLKLVKAGFKHAFLDKREVREMLQATETWIFPLVANAPGLDWRPSPGRVGGS